MLSVKDGKLRFTLPRPGLYELRSQSDLSEGKWLFVSVVYDGTNVTLYIDGAEDTSGTANIDQVDSDQPVRIGFERIISSDPGYLDGRIDEVRIYNRALSDVEIQQLFSLN